MTERERTMRRVKRALKDACDQALEELEKGVLPCPEGVLVTEGVAAPGEPVVEARVLLRVTAP